MKVTDRILITGGSGLIGTALHNNLINNGFTNVIASSSTDCDLTDFNKTIAYFKEVKPDYVFHLAAAVYGIMGNMKNKGLSFYRNAQINLNVIEASRQVAVKKITCMGSGCVYPYPSPGLPLEESMIWDGKPHPSEDSYAQSKRAMLAQLNAYAESYDMDFAFAISANLYGPNDKFDTEYGHVTPSLIRKFYEAKLSGNEVLVWGNGSAKRDFMYSDDAAEALIAIMNNLSGPVNVGSGMVHSIREIVDGIADICDLEEFVRWDESKPNGQDYRSYDLGKLNSTGFKPRVTITDGLRRTYNWYSDNVVIARK